MNLLRNSYFRIILSAGVSFFIISLMMRMLTTGVEPAHQPQFLSIVSAVSLGLVAVYLVCTLLQSLFRALRYNVLINASNPSSAPGLGHTYLVTVVRNMVVDLLPARLGELSYVAMMNRGYNVNGQTCVSSLVISFVFDLIALFCIIIGLLAYHLTSGVPQNWMITAGISVLVISAVAFSLVFWGVNFFYGLMRKLPNSITTAKWASALINLTGKTSQSIETVRKSGILQQTFFLSLGVRIFKYMGLYCLFRAVVGPSFKEFTDIGILSVLAALLGAEGAASLPIPAFMSFGTYESGGLFALTLLGFEKIQAFLTMLALHTWSQFVDYSVGGIGLILFLFVTTRNKQSYFTTNWRKLALTVFVFFFMMSGLLFLVSQYRSVNKLGALGAPEQGEFVTAPEDQKKRLTHIGNQLKGSIVWSSNRKGNHDIFMVTFPSMEIKQLTHHPHVDVFSRFSPDGKAIVFSRSQQPWVSQRNPIPWDIYHLDIKSGKETLIAENGFAPTWSPDGRKVYFQRNAFQFIEHHISTGNERIVHQAGKDGIQQGIELQTPNYNPRIRASAVTLRRATRATSLIFEDGRIQNINGGCQITWGPGFQYLYFVENHAFHKVDLLPFKHSIWLDLSDQFENQYFPKVSNNNKYLVFGGALTGHEHDTADYEIWLWEIGSPKENCVRLTYHSGNDCWPDIFLQK